MTSPELDLPLEEFLTGSPEAIAFFLDRKLSPFTCSGCLPGTLREYLNKRGEDPEEFLRQMKLFMAERKSI